MVLNILEIIEKIIEKFGKSLYYVKSFFVSNYIIPFGQVFDLGFCLSLLSFIIIFILVILLLFRTIYKIGFYGKMHFNTYYDFIGKFKDEGVINDNIPEWNKYCNIENVSIIDTEANKDIKVKERLTKINDFIEKKSNESNNTNHTDKIAKTKSLCNYSSFTTPNVSDYIAIYENKDILHSIICSSRATMKIKSKNKNSNSNSNRNSNNNNISFDVIPIHELLVIHNYSKENTKKYSIDKKNNEMFQANLATLYYYQNSNTPNVFTCIFKYPKIWNVKPLCYLNEYFYKIDKSLDYNFAQKKALQFYLGEKENISSTFEFLNENLHLFDVVITTEVSRLLHLLSNKIYVVIGCVLLGKTIGMLFFKKSISDFSKEHVLELQASVFNEQIEGKVRMACFSRGLIMANKIMNCSMIGINNTSHNNSIINAINMNMVMKMNANINQKGLNANTITNTNAYYLHNYRMKPKNASACLIIT